jgi:DNA-binding response OmpR family regulator
MTEPKAILIVEDSQVQGQALKLFLEERGFRVFWARNGQDGVIQAQISLPDAIVMDIEMPGMNGFEACEKIKANFTTRHIPIIMLTALDDIAHLDRGLSVGAVDFIPKDAMSWPMLLETLANLGAPGPSSVLADTTDLYDYS